MILVAFLCVAGFVAFAIFCGWAMASLDAKATEASRKELDERIRRLERETLGDVTSDLDRELGLVDLRRAAPGAVGSYGEQRKPRPS